MWDFVANAKDSETQCQMAPFAKMIDDLDQPFPGTIVRVPLRTLAQAKKSRICDKEATVSEVAAIMKDFAAEFGGTGLLFMKNVETVTIVTGNEHEPPVTIKISNHVEVRQHKEAVNQAIKTALCKGSSAFDRSFRIEIDMGDLRTGGKICFLVHHTIAKYPEDRCLVDWSKAEALLPWVAVATQLSAPAGSMEGSFYTVLPLPVDTKQPVHIHAVFSLSPDRARIHRTGETSFKLPAQWNEWLFDELIPKAWVNLLEYNAQQYPNQPAYVSWPRLLEDPKSECFGLMGKVLHVIENQHLALWFTRSGYVKSNDALFSSGHESQGQIIAFTNVGVPVIHLLDNLRDAVAGLCKAPPLDPQNLCSRVDRDHVRKATEDTKRILLDYILSHPSSFIGYGALELFPFEDGLYRSVDHNSAFVHRNEDERVLFSRAKGLNIDLDKVSDILKKKLSCGLPLHSSIRCRDIRDFKLYCLGTIFKNLDEDEDIVSLDQDAQAFVLQAWDWIVERGFSIDKDISCLWLVPLSDGTYRKIKPQKASSVTLYAPPGRIGDFLKELAAVDVPSNRPILRRGEMSSKSLKLMTDTANSNTSLRIRLGDAFGDFVLWLSEIREVIHSRSDDDKMRVQEFLMSLFPSSLNMPAVKSALCELEIFQKIVWKVDGSNT
jgi:sacsin